MDLRDVGKMSGMRVFILFKLRNFLYKVSDMLQNTLLSVSTRAYMRHHKRLYEFFDRLVDRIVPTHTFHIGNIRKMEAFEKRIFGKATAKDSYVRNISFDNVEVNIPETKNPVSRPFGVNRLGFGSGGAKPEGAAISENRDLSMDEEWNEVR